MQFLEKIASAYRNGYEQMDIYLQLRYFPDPFGAEELLNFKRWLEDRVSFLAHRRKTFGLFERIFFNFGYRGYRKYVLRELEKQVRARGIEEGLTEMIEDSFKSDEGKL